VSVGTTDQAKPTIADFVTLTKPRLSLLVLVTMALGLYSSHAPFPWWQYLLALASTAGIIGSANAFNCVWESESDQLMARTAQRPLATGRMSKKQGLVFAVVLFLGCWPTLWVFTNALTAVLGLAALVSYVLLYTPLKSRSWTAVLVGAIPGAIPPLMGVTASQNTIDAQGLSLFAILGLWQVPHFLAIAIFRKEEYRAAKLTSLPLQHGDAVTALALLFSAVATVVASLVPYFIVQADIGYLAVAIVAGLFFLGICALGFGTQYRAPLAKWAFLASLVYLTSLMLGLAAFRS
jgi:heme o synthase